MKILLIAPSPPPYGGISNWTLLMSEYIEKQSEIDLTSLNISPKKRCTDGRTLWDRVVIQGLEMLKKQRYLKMLISQKKIDAIHMTTSGQLAIIRDILLLKVAKKQKIPTVYHLHFGRIPEMAEKDTKEWKLIAKAMKLATVVMAIDGVTNKCIGNCFSDIDTACIANPIDISKLPKPIEINSKDIVFLGWNVKTKGIEELIEAWNIVGKKFTEYTLNLVGPSSPKYLSYLKTIASVENIIFSGEMNHEKAMKILNTCCIFILPSYTEGFPNVVVEAMALRKPIIATRVGAIPDMLSDNCGVLINPHSVTDIEQALCDLLLDEGRRYTIAKNAYKKAINKYNIDNVYKQYYEVWKSLINEV